MQIGNGVNILNIFHSSGFPSYLFSGLITNHKSNMGYFCNGMWDWVGGNLNNWAISILFSYPFSEMGFLFLLHKFK